MLSPMTLLSSGAPKQDPIAISGFPDLATTVSATRSATELPMASTVSPKIAVLIIRENFGQVCYSIGPSVPVIHYKSTFKV